MVWNVDYRTARLSPARLADCRTFFFARNAKSGFEPTYFQAFPGNAKHNVGSAGSTLFFAFPGHAAKHLQKKVPEWGQEHLDSAGLVGDDLAVL